MQYRTEIDISHHYPRINPSDQLIFMGSCFAQNMGIRLEKLKFKSVINPLGISYNPVSLAKILEYYLLGKYHPHQSEFWKINDVFAHPDFHSEWNQLKAENILHDINNKLEFTRSLLRECRYLLLTLGTSWVYIEKSSGQVVNNCHKRTPHFFNKKLLSIEEMVEKLAAPIKKLNDLGVQVIITVSPVRHVKEGLENNHRSKARLLECAQQLQEKCTLCHYFPAYEIMMDDLRDYRYYADDLIHPSNLAIDYIWGQFKNHLLSTTSQSYADLHQKLIQAVSHRPFLEKSKAFRDFCNQQITIIQGLEKRFPFNDYSREKAHFEGFI